jgi:lipopolysaccharide transport system permease protein
MPNFTTLAIMFAVGAVIAWCGFVWFQKTRKGFADVL